MENNNTQVSIIMPAHNASRYISQSIESVIKQTYIDWQLIVVDDRSTDDTSSIVASYAEIDNRILLIKNTSINGGAFFARNLALDIANGRYIAFLDSDDLWDAEKLSKQINAMKNGGYFASHCSHFRIDEKGQRLNQVKVMSLVTYYDQLKSNRIPNLTGIYDREKIGIVKQRNIGHEDYDMWLRLLKKTPSFGINKPLASYRVVNGSLSSNKLKSAVWHYNILKNQESLGFVKRCFYFLFYIYYAISKRI